MKKGMATHSSILAQRIPWTEEPGRLQSMGHKESDTAEVTEHARRRLAETKPLLPVSASLCVCEHHRLGHARLFPGCFNRDSAIKHTISSPSSAGFVLATVCLLLILTSCTGKRAAQQSWVPGFIRCMVLQRNTYLSCTFGGFSVQWNNIFSLSFSQNWVIQV